MALSAGAGRDVRSLRCLSIRSLIARCGNEIIGKSKQFTCKMNLLENIALLVPSKQDSKKTIQQ